jgi:hypothetical protein
MHPQSSHHVCTTIANHLWHGLSYLINGHCFSIIPLHLSAFYLLLCKVVQVLGPLSCLRASTWARKHCCIYKEVISTICKSSILRNQRVGIFSLPCSLRVCIDSSVCLFEQPFALSRSWLLLHACSQDCESSYNYPWCLSVSVGFRNYGLGLVLPNLFLLSFNPLHTKREIAMNSN